MKLYHFLNEEYALAALEIQELKVSLFESLNDPFELLGGGSGELETRNALKKYKQGMAETTRLLCCSKSWSNPLLWSHYGDHHRGIALMLEIPEKYIIHVKYTAHRQELNAKDLVAAVKSGGTKKTSDMLLSTKYRGWSYENEARVLFGKSETCKKGALEFVKCSEAIKIKGVLLGPLSTVTHTDIESRIPAGGETQVTSTRLAFESFRVVRNKSKPPIVLRSI